MATRLMNDAILAANDAIASHGTPCQHSANAISLDVVTGSDKKLRRHACGLCRRSWWDSDGSVIPLTEALGAMKDAPRP